MITLDTSLIYQTKYYELNTKRTNTNAYESIDAYSEAHAAKSTPETQATKTSELDQDEIVKSLKLYLPHNRLAVLQMLNHSELVQLLDMLQKGQMTQGLKFFTKPKLLQYIYDLPKEQLLKILFKSYSKEDLLAYFPMKALTGILDNSKINNSDLMKLIKSMPRNLLAQLIESVTGQSAGNKSNAEMLTQISSFKQGALAEGLKSMSYNDLLAFVGKLTQNNEDLFMQFSKNTLMEPLTRLGKNSLAENMEVLDPSMITRLLDELPNNLLAVINTMIDPDKLIGSLLKYHSDLLASLAA